MELESRPALKECTQGNIAAQLGSDGGIKALAQFGHQGRFVVAELMAVGGKIQIPIFLDFQAALLEDRPVAGGQFQDAAKHRERIGHPQEREILLQSLRVDFSPHFGQQEDRLDFGGEGEAICIVQIVQRLDAEMVAGQEQVAAALVPDGKREHAVEPPHALGTKPVIELEDDLGIAVRGECIAVGLELFLQLGLVVDLAVVDDGDQAVGGAHGHVAGGRQIENGKPARAEEDAGAVGLRAMPGAAIVGAAMCLRVDHAVEERRVTPIHCADNATHSWISWELRFDRLDRPILAAAALLTGGGLQIDNVGQGCVTLPRRREGCGGNGRRP